MTAHNKTHGDSKAAEYHSWNSMQGRCKNPKNPGYRHYGGRGIRVCERWQSYENFLLDMGRRPSPDHEIDRIDNDGQYCPENCKWSTRKEQTRNTRHNRMVVVRGELMPLVRAAEVLGITWDMARYRIRKGRSLEGPKGKHAN